MLKRKKKQYRRRRLLTQSEKEFIAKQMFNGMSIKEAVFLFDISGAYAHNIFCEYIEWKMVWKGSSHDSKRKA